MHAQSCPTLCDPTDCSPAGSTVHGIVLARILEWAAISSSRGSSPPRDQTCISFFSCVAGRFFTSQSLGKPRFSVVIYFIHTPASTLAWKTPWMEEPGRLQSMGSLRVRHGGVTSLSLLTFMHWRRKWQPTPVFLPGESQGWGSLVGCHLRWHRVRHN